MNEKTQPVNLTQEEIDVLNEILKVQMERSWQEFLKNMVFTEQEGKRHDEAYIASRVVKARKFQDFLRALQSKLAAAFRTGIKAGDFSLDEAVKDCGTIPENFWSM